MVSKHLVTDTYYWEKRFWLYPSHFSQTNKCYTSTSKDYNMYMTDSI